LHHGGKLGGFRAWWWMGLKNRSPEGPVVSVVFFSKKLLRVDERLMKGYFFACD